MDTKFNHIIAERLNISERQVRNTVSLLEEGATVPFISRYRKEATNSLDEVAVGNIKEEMEKLVELDKRKATILKTIEEQEQLTPELQQKIEQCLDPNELEDIYLPYKPSVGHVPPLRGKKDLSRWRRL
ncbi:Tex-like N-terminal domain-containing protein [Prolixibacter bellariivorans]|uniref:Tex-like N-terminal domain-containing protein n=1 Tax=Prolixibacter bellariivorans TaxID=314319 RepID=UPI000ADE9871